MKKFLIFVLGLVIGALAVYFLFPYTAKSQKEATGYEETIDSLKQEGERLAEKLKIAEQLRPQTPKPATQQTAPQSKSAVQQPAPKQGSTAQPKPQAGQPKQTTQTTENLGKKYFENAVEYTGRKSFQVNKVLENGDAMACEVTDIMSNGYISTIGGTEVLLEGDFEMPYYDKQVVQAAEGQKVLQLGIYRYKVNKYFEANTVPIIAVR